MCIRDSLSEARRCTCEVLNPAEQIALPSFQRGPEQADAPVGPAQEAQEPTEEQLQSQRILEVIRA
eukprot:13678672-Alexandrium_andersonii.AAC.1